MSRALFVICIALSSAAFAPAQERYAVFLKDSPPAASRAHTQAAQSSLRSRLVQAHFSVTGSSSTLLNAVFVATAQDRLPELRSLPGVSGVVPLHRYRRALNSATRLLNAPQAWSLAGGMQNAGAGIKIAILDTGIDQNHPALQDSALTAPAGFPRCNASSDCDNFTSGKVIVARSYVRRLALGAGPIDPATSRADDYSARDRNGHGTAMATCAAGNTAQAAVSIAGMAPKAWLGNYKIFGSPQVNDFSTDDVLIAALEDALADGMDVVVLSAGFPAFTGPLDTGAACGQPAGVPCDVGAAAVESLANKGVLIVAAAGDNGVDGQLRYPTFDSIVSPATAPSVLTVGGFSNSHNFTPVVRVPGSNVPSALQAIPATATGAGTALGAVAAPLADVAAVSPDPYACAPLPAYSLAGTFALIERGPPGPSGCTFFEKMTNATSAGAIGAVFYDTPSGAASSPPPDGLYSFSQPAVFLANPDGAALQAFIAQFPGYTAILDPAGAENPLAPSQVNRVVNYTSAGPSAGLNALKPDLLAVAGGGFSSSTILMGGQTFDPLGDLYSATGYVAAAGTSFAAPLAAGAAALVRQAHPGWSAAQIKSALVNTTSRDIATDDSGKPAVILQTGAGKLAADQSLRTTLVSEPASLSFGALTPGNLPAPLTFRITNFGGSPAALTLSVVSQGTASSAALTLDQPSLTLAAGASAVVTASLTGTVPAAGLYSGFVTLAGGPVNLRVPYLYLVGSGAPANFTVLASGGNSTSGLPLPFGPIAFRITDANGVAISGLPVNFVVAAGNAALSNVSATTDAWGVAAATVTPGSPAGDWAINGCLNQCTATNQFQSQFTGTSRPAPAVAAGGVINAAAADPGTPLAPGSYFSIYGAGLSDFTDITSTARLPMAIDSVNVTFDVPSAGLSVPAHLVFVSAGQINAQVPWELNGQSTAQMKVIIDRSYGNVVSVPLATYAPALFENPPGSGAAAAVDPNDRSILSAQNPARRGAVISLYANGLGPVSNQPASGELPAALASTTSNATVSIGGQSANVLFSGLTPGLPGLYQLNVVVPQGIGTGQQPVAISIGGKTSRSLTLFVR